MKYTIPEININDYYYDLPEERISQFPVEERDHSKLLVYQNGQISETIFSDVHNRLPDNSHLIFNDTRVFKARMQFRKKTGATIELFCLTPYPENTEINAVFQQKNSSVWKCIVGNAKKWKNEPLHHELNIDDERVVLSAEKIDKHDNVYIINFNWSPANYSFAQIIESLGRVPLPPYVKREDIELDKVRYQTVYAENNGSVAAPTAGLHFTPEVLEILANNSIELNFLTLHVGAGTFIPVSAHHIKDHIMHSEKVVVRKELINNVLSNIEKALVPVGTTTVRTLESLYWFGVKLLKSNFSDTNFTINQWDAYSDESPGNISRSEALLAVRKYLSNNNLAAISGTTQMIIVPGYEYKMTDALITNFHQPGSTLLLLVAALIGEDWEKVYQYALDHNFRFLSYGDSCLFFRNRSI